MLKVNWEIIFANFFGYLIWPNLINGMAYIKNRWVFECEQCILVLDFMRSYDLSRNISGGILKHKNITFLLLGKTLTMKPQLKKVLLVEDV